MDATPGKHRSMGFLLHGPQWHLTRDEHPIADGITLWRAEASPVWPLYDRLCQEKGLEDGEPLAYQVAVVLSPSVSHEAGDLGDPYDLGTLIANLLVAHTAVPVGLLTEIASFDAFSSAAWHHQIHNYGGHQEFAAMRSGTINDQTGASISTAYQTLRSPGLYGKTGRIWTALAYFYYAWTSRYFDLAIISLAVCIELLFAPHSQGETTHQIAYNYAWLMGDAADDRESLYKEMKAFYGLRSRIVHGAIPDDETLLAETPVAYARNAAVLRRLLTDRDLASQFEDEEQRKTLFRSYLFE